MTHGDEVSSEPGLVLHGVVGVLLYSLDGDLGVVHVGVLRGRVVPPDDHVLHFVRRNTAAHRHLQDRDRHYISYSVKHTVIANNNFESSLGDHKWNKILM